MTNEVRTIIQHRLDVMSGELVMLAENYGGVFHGHYSLHIPIGQIDSPVYSIVIELCYDLQSNVFFVANFDANNILVNRQSPLRGQRFVSALAAYMTAIRYAAQYNVKPKGE